MIYWKKCSPAYLRPVTFCETMCEGNKYLNSNIFYFRTRKFEFQVILWCRFEIVHCKYLIFSVKKAQHHIMNIFKIWEILAIRLIFLLNVFAMDETFLYGKPSYSLWKWQECFFPTNNRNLPSRTLFLWIMNFWHSI